MTEPTRRSSTILILVALVALMSACAWQQNATIPVTHQTIGQPAERASRAAISIAAGRGRLQIDALEQSDKLIAGEVVYDARNRLEQQFGLNGDIATFTLRERDDGRNLLVGGSDAQLRWDLQLNRELPLHLTVDTGIGENVLDLAELQVTGLSLHTGVGNTSLTLPRQGHVMVDVTGGIGNLTITVPRGVAARIDAGSDLGNVRVPGDYTIRGGVYSSPDFASAANRVDLQASKGIGSITVMTASE